MEINLSKYRVPILGWITLFGFSIAAYVLIRIFSDGGFNLFNTIYPVYIQLGIGSVAGIVFGLLAYYTTQLPLIKPAAEKYGDLIQSMELSVSDIWFLSICAGVGEEIFFRGVIQEFWGIWITAIVFVGIHGYLNPKNWRLSIYGILMTLIIGLIGYMKDYLGLWSCIAAHTMIDVVIFSLLRKATSQSNL